MRPVEEGILAGVADSRGWTTSRELKSIQSALYNLTKYQLRKNITRHILVEGGHSSTSILLLKQQSTKCSLLFYIQF